MSAAYTSPLPRDRMGNPMQQYPQPIVAKVTRVSENAATSSVITLNDNTTSLEITAIGATAFMKWIATTNTNPSVITAAGTANFDHVIPSGTYRRFVVPIERQVASSIAGLNTQNGLYSRVAYIGAASILTTEY